jgi:hypothetical protein
MESMGITFLEIYGEYCEFIDQCHRLNCFTTSSRIQKSQVQEVQDQILKTKAYKEQAIQHQDEHCANHLFHMQCVLNAMRSSLLMWIELKQEKYFEAWVLLVDAQEYLNVALQISDYIGIRNFEDFLVHVENAVFPQHNKYNSPGFTETIGDCSICRENFSLCDHIEQKVYTGKLCFRINRRILSADHVALVDNPKDKRCIITKISNEAREMINIFTKEIDGQCPSGVEPVQPKVEEEGIQIECTILSMKSLDFL